MIVEPVAIVVQSECIPHEIGEYITDDSVLGPDVVLVRTMPSGDIVRESMPALLAHIALADDEDNGVVFISGHIEYKQVLDKWGTSP